MKDILQDLISHTYDLGCFDLIKIKGDESETTITGLASDHTVVIEATLKNPIKEFEGTFGMPNMGTLKTLLGIELYDDDAEINVVSSDNGPEYIHFKTADGTFENDYRFMVQSIVDKMLKTVKFNGATWHVTFVPTSSAIMRLGYQAQVNSEETTFQSKVVKNNLVFTFGDHTSNSGEFVFEHDIEGNIIKDWHWPINNIIKILSLNGDKTMSFSDDGAAMITVDSGLIQYTYIFPAQTK